MNTADEENGTGVASARPPESRAKAGGVVSCLVVVAAALSVGCFDLGGSGTLWPDGPQYANAAAMFRDWMLSDELLHPYRFAQGWYAQYPAFHMPFHPPAYPFVLALFFLFAGVSYVSARVFVALCLAAAGCFFYATLRRMETTRAGALLCALVLLTTPEVVLWSRDTMSEVPALALLLAGTHLFLRWLDSRKFRHCLAAFLLAEAAFLSRVTTAGVLPVWALFFLLTPRERRPPARHALPLAAAYLLLNAGWVLFVSRFSKYETGAGVASFLSRVLSLRPAGFYLSHVPEAAGWGTLFVAALGLAFAFRRGRREAAGLYWACWLAGSFAFLLALGLVPERRYFFYVLPALPGLAAVLFGAGANKTLRARVTPALVALCLAANLLQLGSVPRGVVGYGPLARELARSDARGNIMSLGWATPDFIFRYRAAAPAVERRVIRGDRTLAVRLGNYGGFSGGVRVEPTVVAHDGPEVLDILRRGRVRYLITCEPDDPRRDERTFEMVLAHEVARSLPGSFSLRGTFPVSIDYAGDMHTPEPLKGRAFVWEFTEELPPGPSELPVLVPTADMMLR